MSDNSPFKPIPIDQIRSAASRIQDAQRKKLKATLETRTHHHFDGGHDQTGATLPKQVLAREATIEQFNANPTTPQFDTPLIAAALRVADVIQPEFQEARTLAIAEMVLAGANSQEIALVLNIDPKIVRSEMLVLHKLRKIGVEQNPELARILVERELDVMEVTTEMVRTDMSLLTMLQHELELDHQEKLDAMAAKSPYAWKKGMNALKVDAYFRARDSLGKHLDRVANLQGLMHKHLQPTSVNQTNTVVQFGNDALNSLADHFMKMSGNVPALIAEAQANDQLSTIDVEA